MRESPDQTPSAAKTGLKVLQGECRDCAIPFANKITPCFQQQDNKIDFRRLMRNQRQTKSADLNSEIVSSFIFL
jgi:hypothetical protein